MKHEIDLKNYEIHTDLALEKIENEKDGYQVEEKKIENVSITKVVIQKDGSKKLRKKVGTYITIEFEDVSDHENRELVTNIFQKELLSMMEQLSIKKDASCLVIGLGNEKSTPDALGPITLSKILVTNHLFQLGEVEEGVRPVSLFLPGVTGETGLETSELVGSVISMAKPDFVIVIDALASKSIERVGHTIQITDTGIHPGSGIGNERKEISQELYHIPVISIGIPTVVDAVTIVSDTIGYMYKHFSYTKEHLNDPSSKFVVGINYLKEEIKEETDQKEKWFGMIGSLNEEEIRNLIFEVLSPIGFNLMVTPKEINFMIEELGSVLGRGINEALQSYSPLFKESDTF